MQMTPQEFGLVNEKNMEILSGSFDPTIVEDSFIDNVIGTVNP